MWLIGLLGLMAIAACSDGKSTVGVAAEGEDPNRPPASSIEECIGRWDADREAALAEGYDDGEARRRADEIELACEEQMRQSAPPSSVTPICKPLGERVDDLADVDQFGSPGYVFVRCATEPSASGFPLQAVRRDFKLSGTPADQVNAAIDAYLDGPSADERSAGYITTVKRNLVREVSVSDRAVTIDLAGELIDSGQTAFGTTAGTAHVLAELSATVLAYADSVQFTLEGSCEKFWAAADMDALCDAPMTRERPAGTVGGPPQDQG